MIRFIVIIFLFYYLFKTLTKFDKVKGKVRKLPKMLLGVLVAFTISFIVMNAMEKSDMQWMIDWAGVAAMASFTLIISLLSSEVEKVNE